MNPSGNLTNQRWTSDKDLQLMAMLQRGDSHALCAQFFGRTEKGIESRATLLRKRFRFHVKPEQEEADCSLYTRWLAAGRFVADPKNRGCV